MLVDVSPSEAAALIEDNAGNPAFVILDIRTPEEFANERLADAINIDFYADSFRAELSQLDRSQTYFIYCRTARRTGETMTVMRDLGFTSVYHLAGGIIAWKAEVLPTITGTPAQAVTY